MDNEITKYHGLYEPPSDDFKLNKIIFLDIDGVLVNRKILAKKNQLLNDNFHNFDQYCVKNLEYIVGMTNAYIVISSTWRKRDLNWLREIFKLREFKYWDKIIGETCRGYHFITKEKSELHFFRGNEIDAWIRQFVELDQDGEYVKDAQYHYVIVDDDSDMLYWQKDNFIKTVFEIGLSEQNAIDATKILSGLNLNN